MRWNNQAATSNLIAKLINRVSTIMHRTTHAVGGTDTVFPADPNADRFLKWNNTSNQLEWAEAGGSFAGTMDDITDGATYVKTENNLTDELLSQIGGSGGLTQAQVLGVSLL